MTHSISAIAAWACQTFGLSWGDYTHKQYALGENFLQITFAHDPELGDSLRASATFWNWWRYQWERRDQRLRNELASLDEPLSPADMAELYQANHDSAASGLHPHSVIFRASLRETMEKEATYE